MRRENCYYKCSSGNCEERVEFIGGFFWGGGHSPRRASIVRKMDGKISGVSLFFSEELFSI